MKILNIFIFCLAFFCVFCGQNTPQKEIIAHVANKNIYLDDYLQRAELTVRPAYLKGQSNNEKRLVLNALIAEKILAIEAQKDTTITENEKLQNYVKGITEQKMREMHYKQFAKDQVVLDKSEIEELMQNVNRKFSLSYFDIAITENYDSLAQIFQQNKRAFELVVQHYYPDKKSQKQAVAWNNVLNTEMYEKLYRNNVKPGDIIGPVIRDDNRVFFFRVDGWQNTVMLSETDRQTIREKTENKICEMLALENYEQVIAKLMAGKKLVFNLEGLLPLINMLGPVFLNEERNNFFNNQVERYKQEVRLDTLQKSNYPNGHKNVFTVDGNNWTIDNILHEIQHHPLVFRKRRFAKSEFGKQLKIALVDLIRDHYITKEAYEMGFDETPEIKNTQKVWQDHFYAVAMREKLLMGKNDSSARDIEYIDQKVRKLRAEYMEEISINEDLLNQTEIAEVQLMAFQRNVPFPMVSPGFPLLTLDDN